MPQFWARIVLILLHSRFSVLGVCCMPPIGSVLHFNEVYVWAHTQYYVAVFTLVKEFNCRKNWFLGVSLVMENGILRDGL